VHHRACIDYRWMVGASSWVSCSPIRGALSMNLSDRPTNRPSRRPVQPSPTDPSTFARNLYIVMSAGGRLSPPVRRHDCTRFGNHGGDVAVARGFDRAMRSNGSIRIIVVALSSSKLSLQYTSLILASEKYSMWNQRMLCTNVKLSSECSQSLTLLT